MTYNKYWLNDCVTHVQRKNWCVLSNWDGGMRQWPDILEWLDLVGWEGFHQVEKEESKAPQAEGAIKSLTTDLRVL